MDLASARRWPIVVHTATTPTDECSQVRDCLDVAEAYPDVRFDLAHSLRFDREGLSRAAELDNVWVDCSAHTVHCASAANDWAVTGPRDTLVDADYTKPAQVLEAVHAILGPKYLWGTDMPFQSWCEDDFRYVQSYDDEVDVLFELPENVRHDMATVGPEAWLMGAS